VVEASEGRSERVRFVGQRRAERLVVARPLANYRIAARHSPVRGSKETALTVALAAVLSL